MAESQSNPCQVLAFVSDAVPLSIEVSLLEATNPNQDSCTHTAAPPAADPKIYNSPHLHPASSVPTPTPPRSKHEYT